MSYDYADDSWLEMEYEDRFRSDFDDDFYADDTDEWEEDDEYEGE